MLGIPHTGSEWRQGLPPGLYETRRAPARPREVRLDVAAFVGVAERGPINTPVPVDSMAEYRRAFGEPGVGRLLPEAVDLFFANGGRRCVVVRVLNYPAARPAQVRLPGMVDATGQVPLLYARNPGAWGNRISVITRWLRRPLVEFDFSLGPPLSARLPVTDDIVAGSLLHFEYRVDSEVHEAIAFVASTTLAPEQQPDEPGFPVPEVDCKLDRPLPVEVARPPAAGEPLALVISELTVQVDLAVGEAEESWSDAALHPLHPRFLPRQLARRAISETYMQPQTSVFDGLDPEGDAPLLALDPLRSGSELVRPPKALLKMRLEPAFPSGEIRLSRTERFHWGPVERLREQAESALAPRDGLDENMSIEREHFFSAPDPERQIAESFDLGEYPFRDQPAPLDALLEYEGRNELEPISLINLPDLVHPDQTIPQPPEVGVPASWQFGECRVAPHKTAEPAQWFVGLGLRHQPGEIVQRQRQLLEWIEDNGARAVAVLDLPPSLVLNKTRTSDALAAGQALGPAEILAWRRELASHRAAAYTPYLRKPPAADPDAPLISVPPGGAVCGVIARRERARGVHVAPANESIRGIVDLAWEPPDPAFLHRARINAVRTTELGPTLLGSRTTAFGVDWTHLPVRRLIDYLARQLVVDNQWAVFEPNRVSLWRRLRQSAERRLQRAFDAGAFAGATAAESYFVRSDRDLHSSGDLDDGRAWVLVGVAPAVPNEFLVFRLAQARDGSLLTEFVNG